MKNSVRNKTFEILLILATITMVVLTIRFISPGGGVYRDAGGVTIACAAYGSDSLEIEGSGFHASGPFTITAVRSDDPDDATAVLLGHGTTDSTGSLHALAVRPERWGDGSPLHPADLFVHIRQGETSATVRPRHGRAHPPTSGK